MPEPRKRPPSDSPRPRRNEGKVPHDALDAKAPRLDRDRRATGKPAPQADAASPPRGKPAPRGPEQRRAKAVIRHSTDVRVRMVAGQGWEVLQPRCAMERAEDLAEVTPMLEQQEYDIAQDELLWLLQGCANCLDAHRLLGELAIQAGNFEVGRGHFGRVLLVVERALDDARTGGPLPYSLSGNRVVHECGQGLLYCLGQLRKTGWIRKTKKLLQRWDPTDPLGIDKIDWEHAPPDVIIAGSEPGVTTTDAPGCGGAPLPLIGLDRLTTFGARGSKDLASNTPPSAEKDRTSDGPETVTPPVNPDAAKDGHSSN